MLNFTTCYTSTFYTFIEKFPKPPNMPISDRISFQMPCNAWSKLAVVIHYTSQTIPHITAGHGDIVTRVAMNPYTFHTMMHITRAHTHRAAAIPCISRTTMHITAAHADMVSGVVAIPYTL